MPCLNTNYLKTITLNAMFDLSKENKSSMTTYQNDFM